MRQYLKLTGTFLLLLLFFTSCATTNKISQDFKPGSDFSSYKTFNWHNFSSDINGSDQIAIQREIEQQLSQQGFKLVPASGAADLVLDLTMIKQAASKSNTGVGLSIGLPVGRNGSIGLGTSKLLGNDEKYAALIILDITVQATNQILWRGSAEDVPLDYFSLRNQTKLNTVLTNLTKQFPPK